MKLQKLGGLGTFPMVSYIISTIWFGIELLRQK